MGRGTQREIKKKMVGLRKPIQRDEQGGVWLAMPSTAMSASQSRTEIGST